MSGPAPASRVHRRAWFDRLLTGGAPRPQLAQILRARRESHVHPGLRIARAIAGWLVIAVGIAGIVLPLLPAIVLIPAGVALVGRQSLLIRWTRTRMKLLLRIAETWPGWPGRLGRFAAAQERRFAKLLRERRLRRFAA